MKLRRLLAASVFGFIGYSALYNAWRRQALQQLQSESTLIETAAGPVEYHITRGKPEEDKESPVVLIVHGSPGGYDQSRAFAKLLALPGTTFLTVSRPGYLRTPITSGVSPEEQADLYAALLETLGISNVAVIGISGGGPSALQFALRHSQKCRQLILISGVTHRYSEIELKQALPHWLQSFQKMYERLITFDPLLAFLLIVTRAIPTRFATTDLLRSVTLYELRKEGYHQDMEQFERIPPEGYALESLKAPVFIVHGTNDDEVPFSHAQLLAQRLKAVKLLAIPGGNHMVFYTHARLVIPEIQAFLNLQASDWINIHFPARSVENP